MKTKDLGWLFAVLIGLPSGGAIATDEPERTILATGSYFLSDAEVRHYSVEAMEGAAEPATKLMNYYWYEKKDVKTSNSWAMIGAENGSAEAQFRTYQVLGVSRDLQQQRRALFWLKRSASQGYEIARKIFKVCNSLTSTHSDSAHSQCFGPGSQD